MSDDRSAQPLPSTKPYLIRAIYDWCVDHGFTPHLAVAVDDTTRVPREYVRDGQIVLNVSPLATHRLVLGEREITFEARFGGRPYSVIVPIGRVIAIFARENGQGLAFEPEETVIDVEKASETPAAPSASENQSQQDRPPPGRGTHLKRIK